MWKSVKNWLQKWVKVIPNFANYTISSSHSRLPILYHYGSSGSSPFLKKEYSIWIDYHTQCKSSLPRSPLSNIFKFSHWILTNHFSLVLTSYHIYDTIKLDLKMIAKILSDINFYHGTVNGSQMFVKCVFRVPIFFLKKFPSFPVFLTFFPDFFQNSKINYFSKWSHNKRPQLNDIKMILLSLIFSNDSFCFHL